MAAERELDDAARRSSVMSLANTYTDFDVLSASDDKSPMAVKL